MRDMRCGRVGAVAGACAHWALLGAALAMLGATAWVYARGATSYIDNGDGYYLYAARRVAQGVTLYRDVMGTQPPVVYLLGAAAFKLGAPLQGIRLLSAAMRVLATALVYLLSRRLFDSKPAAALAALLYTLLPIGLVWDRSFDVNPPLTLVALLAALALSYDTRRMARASGLLAALALFTKDLYLPLLAVTLVYLIMRRRRLLAPYLQGLLGGLVLLGGALVVYAGPDGPRDAFLGQDGSPFNPAWFVAAVAYVAASEGGIVLVALAGAVIGRYARRRILTPRAPGGSDYAPWLLVGSAAVLLATLKEGTAGPVFQLAEPAVALLAAYGALWAWRRRATKPVMPVALALPAVLLLSVVSIVGADRAALAWGNSGEVARVVALTRERAHRGAVIVAPPYYALLTGTHLPGDAADTYIVARRVARGDGAATAWVRQVVAGIDARRYPVVLVDLRLAAIAPLMAALQRTYRPLYADTLPPALHVIVWVPAYGRPVR